MKLRVPLAALLAALFALPSGPVTAAPRRSVAWKVPADTHEFFDFTVRRAVDTHFTRLPPEVEPFAFGEVEQSLASVVTTASGRLERTLARVFRDFTYGLVTRILSIEGEVERAGGTTPLAVDGLVGKSVSMRSLPSGELLDSVGWAQLAGARRGGHVVTEVLLQTIPRLPHKIPGKDETVGVTYRLRWSVDPHTKRDQTWTVGFRRAEPPADCKRCTALTYEAEILETARDEHPARPMAATGKGTSKGTLVMGPKKTFVSHDFLLELERTVRSERENGGVRGEVVQKERVEVSLRRGEAP